MMRLHVVRGADFGLMTQVYIIQWPEIPSGDVRALNFDRDGKAMITGVKSELGIFSLDQVKPAFILDETTFRSLLREFGKLAKNEGFPAPSEERLEGQLEATKLHLEDMRSIALDKLKP